ncbi:MAG: glutamine amidotransferase [Actinomycetota bacterium]|nr:glutamine amidotransferase [Actinomycetota bacterium]
MNTKVRILQLYPRDMNIYGDWGNTLVLRQRLTWHGYEPQIIDYNPGDDFPDGIDLVVGGGGQDSGQGVVAQDLLRIGPRLHELADADVPMLVVCGLYQLFGHYFDTVDGTRLTGIGLLDVHTVGGTTRLIGNITTRHQDFGDIFGYENHSGKTYLGTGGSALGSVVQGAGNNGDDGTEGARYRNVLGTYLHGSVLPKNPRIADFLIERAVRMRQPDLVPASIDDRYAEQARRVAATRPR